MKKPPCDPECPRRKPACSGTCKEFRIWKHEIRAEKEWLAKENEALGFLANNSAKRKADWHRTSVKGK